METEIALVLRHRPGMMVDKAFEASPSRHEQLGFFAKNMRVGPAAPCNPLPIYQPIVHAYFTQEHFKYLEFRRN